MTVSKVRSILKDLNDIKNGLREVKKGLVEIKESMKETNAIADRIEKQVSQQT